MNPIFVSVFLSFFLTLIPYPENITNQSGGYMIQAQKGWYHKMEGTSTTIMATSFLIVTATCSVSIYESEYETLEETFEKDVAKLSKGFLEYIDLGRGVTQINNVKTMWHKMQDTEEDGRIFTNLIYVMQPRGRKVFVVSCSAENDEFGEYEGDFKKMVYSFKIKG